MNIRWAKGWWIAVFAISLAACGGKDEPVEAPPAKSAAGNSVQAQPQQPAKTDARTPEEIAKAFMDAGNAGDQSTFLGLVTTGAKNGLTATSGENGNGFSLKGGQFDSFAVGASAVKDDEAEVPIDIKSQNEGQKILLKMKKEEKAWRVYALDMTLAKDVTVTVNFEELGEMFQQVAQGLGDAVRVGMQHAMEEWNAGGSPEEIAANRVNFLSLQSLTEKEYKKSWMNSDSFEGRTVGAALSELSNRLSLDFVPGEHAGELDVPVSAKVKSKSNLEAFELLCAQVGLHPIYPDLNFDMGAFGKALLERLAAGVESMVKGDFPALKISGIDAATSESMTAPGQEPQVPAITLKPGPRAYPAAFAGPFMVEVVLVDEVPPHGTGTLSLKIRALGVNPGVLQLTSDETQSTQFTSVADSQGNSLIETDVSYIGGGKIIGGAYQDVFHLNLHNLLRDVSEIHVVAGRQNAILPLEVKETVFDKPAAGAKQTAGKFKLEVREVGEHSRVDITGPGSAIENLRVLMAADDAEGKPLGVVYQGSSRFLSDTIQANMNTASAPSKIYVKIISKTKTLEYPFELGPIQLQHYGEMPEKIAKLDFGGFETPVSVEFVDFKGGDPNFPKVALRVINHSNKDATSMFADFVYADAKGKKIDNMPTTLMGAFDSGGVQPLAAAGATSETESTAFSMPEHTKTLIVNPISVDFVDGTTWRAKQ